MPHFLGFKKLAKFAASPGIFFIFSHFPITKFWEFISSLFEFILDFTAPQITTRRHKCLEGPYGLLVYQSIYSLFIFTIPASAGTHSFALVSCSVTCVCVSVTDGRTDPAGNWHFRSFIDPFAMVHEVNKKPRAIQSTLPRVISLVLQSFSLRAMRALCL